MTHDRDLAVGFTLGIGLVIGQCDADGTSRHRDQRAAQDIIATTAARATP